MPKISILIFFLELQSQIGLIENNVSMAHVLESISSMQTHIPLFPSGLNGSALASTIPFIAGGVSDVNTVYILKNLLLISSLLSLIIGTVVGLAQSRIKRLLSYSTVSHLGFILLALAINSEQSIDSLIFYIIQYSITNLNTFLIILALGYILKSSMQAQPKGIGINKNSNNSPLGNKGTETDIKFISELKGQFFSNPLLSISLTVCLFSMAGIPPLMGFFAKQFVLYSAIQSGYYFMAIVAIIVSVISASYYLKIIRVLHADSADSSDKDQTPKGLDTMITNFHSFLISTLTLSILLFVLKPSLLLNSTQLLSLSLFYY